jgi:hypothetical protein
MRMDRTWGMGHPPGMWKAPAVAVAGLAAGLCACGGAPDAGAVGDGGNDGNFGIILGDSGARDVRVLDVSAEPSRQPWNRMQSHRGMILPSMHVELVYAGQAGVDGAESFDTFVRWLLTSSYWGILAQYGVQAGTVDGSVRVDANALIPPELVAGGLIDGLVLDARIQQVLHPTSSPDGGAEADAGSGGDGGDAGNDAEPPLSVPKSQAYVFFLPDGVNVTLNGIQTCDQAGGYHSFDADGDPYIIIPPCSVGRSTLTLSHELAETATDPTNQGWYSDMDAANAGGEVGDLCNFPVASPVEGWTVTELWSNADGDCEPQQ